MKVGHYPEIVVRIASSVIRGRLEPGRSPRTVAAFVGRLPWSGQLVHARWSGEALWMPLGDTGLYDGFEDATSFPAPGQVLWHPAGASEAELLIAYGPTRFASKAGQLAGNHFLTLDADPVELAEIGRSVLWNGAVDVVFERKPD
ncbi:MAG TPA: DUF3830 family protein [Gemmatimonadaceae bacterium]